MIPPPAAEFARCCSRLGLVWPGTLRTHATVSSGTGIANSLPLAFWHFNSTKSTERVIRKSTACIHELFGRNCHALLPDGDYRCFGFRLHLDKRRRAATYSGYGHQAG